MGQRGSKSVKQEFIEELKASCMFFLASLLTGFVSLIAFGFVFAKREGANHGEALNAEGFLANEQRALSFYKVFSAAYDILNPYLYDESMRGQIVSQLKNGMDLRVLDVGCGTGYTTAGILKRDKSCEVVALDMNPVQLKKAVEKLALEKHRVFISRGDADNLPFTDESFDAVISVGAIEYFPDPEKALKEFARVTKSNGTVIVGGPESAWFSKFALNRVFYTPSAREMERILRKAELKNVSSCLTGVKTFFGTGQYVAFAIGNKPD